MKTCNRCGKKTKEVKEFGMRNYIKDGESADWEYSLCPRCAEVTGCAMGNFFYEFVLDWKFVPSKKDCGPQAEP